MKRLLIMLLSAASSIFTASFQAEAAEDWLIRDHSHQGRLFIPQKHGQPLQLAAEELRHYLELMTGQRLPLAWGPPRPTDGGIVLTVREPGEWEGKMSAQAFTIDENGRFITIEGNTETAVLYGVYQYLHELGVRWFSPGPEGELVPPRNEIAIGRRRQDFTPSFIQRHLCHSGSFQSHYDATASRAEQERKREEYSLWFIRNRAHFLYNIPRADWFEFNWPIRAGSGHGLRRYVLGNVNIEDEPERFPMLMRDGELVRTDSGPRQICFTNDRNVEAAVKQVIALIEQTEAARQTQNDDLYETWAAVSMGLADNTGICECPDCTAEAGEPPYNDDRLVWSFYNRVIEGVNQQKPEGKIYLFAPYMDLSRPPDDVSINSNLVASTARTTTWSARPEDAPYYPFDREFYYNVLATKEAGAEVRAREYVLWWGAPQPLNILDAAQKYHELGYTHYNLEVMNRSEQIWPILWVLAQYTWDATQDPQQLLAEYCRGSFGPVGGEIVLELLRRIDANSREIHRIQWGNLADTSRMLPDQLIERGRRQLTEAWSVAEGGAKERLANFRDTFEMMSLQALAYRAYCEALNLRTENAITQARNHLARFTEFWEAQSLARTCSPRIMQIMNNLKTGLDNLDHAVPTPRQGLETQSQRIKELFAGEEVPENLPNLFELPELWDFKIDYQNVGIDEGWHRPEFTADTGWQSVSTWNIFMRQGYPSVHGHFWHRLEFEAPEFPEDKQIIMRMGSLDDEGEIYLNGQLVYEQDSPNNWNRSFAFDITPYIKPGTGNVIAVRGHTAYGAGGLWRPSAIYTD